MATVREMHVTMLSVRANGDNTGTVIKNELGSYVQKDFIVVRSPL